MEKENYFLSKLKEANNLTKTENDALTYKSTLSSLLDFFGLAGAMRSRPIQDITQLFSLAFNEDPLLALKALFYFRDIRAGQGERRVFRTILQWLGINYGDIVAKNLANVPFYGRWDDLYVLAYGPVHSRMFEFMKNQFIIDVRAESSNVTLLGKWLKSINTSSPISKKLGKLTMKEFGIKSQKQYRTGLSLLRKKIRIVESQMCKNAWQEIKYENVPSKAGMIYSKAFRRHDPEGYAQYIEDVKSGKKKIQTKTLYPYEILRKIIREPAEEYNVMWEKLPDYTAGKEENSIVVCDTSGSMGTLTYQGYERTVEPIMVSVSLAMYFAERAKGPYHNHFITFSSRPALQEIRGNNLYEKFINLANADWDGNTDLIAVFKLILDTAIRNSISQDEMIQKIYIISDMEFDYCVENKTNFQYIQELYSQAGYNMPKLVFWNVEARQTKTPITMNDENVYLISGLSPSIFKSLMQSKSVNAIDLMLEVLNSERYDKVVL